MTVRIVQFGEGVFLRGFCDWMVERLRREAGADLRISLVQPRNSDGVARLMEQGGRFTVVQSGLDGGRSRSEHLVVEAIDQGLNTHQDPGAYAALAVDPSVRVVLSNTTEAGIVWSEDDAALGAERHLVRSFPGKLAWFLTERFERLPESEILFILPCELIAENGRTLEELVRRMARAWGLGDDFSHWLDERVVFFDTLVDRIVPGAPAEGVELSPGVQDQFSVQVEWFHSWYLQGPRSLLEVLPLDALDLQVHFVEDLRPYRELKVRVLNGTHSTMAPVAVALGIDTVSEAMDHHSLAPWLQELVREEISPTLEVPTSEAEAFIDATWERFRNPYIKHQVRSILLNASAKVPSRLGDIVRERDAVGHGCPHIAAGVAAWLWLARTEKLDDDPAALELLAGWWDREEPAGVARLALHDSSVLGNGDWPESFVAEVAARLERIVSEGPGVLLD